MNIHIPHLYCGFKNLLSYLNTRCIKTKKLKPADIYYMTKDPYELLNLMAPNEIQIFLSRVEWLFAPGDEILSDKNEVNG